MYMPGADRYDLILNACSFICAVLGACSALGLKGGARSTWISVNVIVAIGAVIVFLCDR